MAERANRRVIRGVVTPLTALMMVVLISFGALAVDVAYLFSVKAQLQNAADAGALAGAEYYKASPTLAAATPCSAAFAKSQAEGAQCMASIAVSQNSADGANSLVVDSAEVGYWHLTTGWSATPVKGALQAMRVRVTKNASQNGTPSLLLAKVFGATAPSVSAYAVAVRPSPQWVEPGQLFPITLSQCMFDPTYGWMQVKDPSGDPNALDNLTPVLDPALKDASNPNGRPKVFPILTSYTSSSAYAACPPGQWTSFADTSGAAGSASSLSSLITTLNPDRLKVMGPTDPDCVTLGAPYCINVASGAIASLYTDVNNCAAPTWKICTESKTTYSCPTNYTLNEGPPAVCVADSGLSTTYSPSTGSSASCTYTVTPTRGGPSYSAADYACQTFGSAFVASGSPLGIYDSRSRLSSCQTSCTAQTIAATATGTACSNYGYIDRVAGVPGPAGATASGGNGTCGVVRIPVIKGALATSGGRTVYGITGFSCMRILAADTGGKTVWAQLADDKVSCPPLIATGAEEPTTPGAVRHARLIK